MITILGAGIAGLTAANELIKGGVPGKEILVLEKEDDVGGLAQTKTYDGFSFDLGPHRWFTKSPELDRLWTDVNAPEILELDRLTRIWYKKRLFNYPLSPSNALKNLGMSEAGMALLTYSAQTLTKLTNRSPANMEEAFIQQFGMTLFNAFFREYNQKLWGGNGCKDLSPDWVKQRVKNLSLAQAVLDAFGLSRKGKVISLVDRFKYPSKGTGQFCHNMAKRISDSGGTVLCNSDIRKIIRSGKRINYIIANRNGVDEEFATDFCISSIPIDVFTRSVSPELSLFTRDTAAGLRYRDLIFVVLFVNRPRVMEDNWIYVQDSKLSFNRFMDMGNWNQSLAPSGMTSVIFEITCDMGDEDWMLHENQWVNRVSEEFVSEFRFVEKREITGGKVFKKTHAYPVYTLDYRKRLGTIKEELREIENLQLIGRNGLFRYNNMDHSMASGIAAASNYLGSSIDIEAINLEEEYHEEIKNERVKG